MPNGRSRGLAEQRLEKREHAVYVRCTYVHSIASSNCMRPVEKIGKVYLSAPSVHEQLIFQLFREVLVRGWCT